MIENDSYAEVINEMLIDSQSAAICLALTNTIKSEDLLKKCAIIKATDAQ